MRFKRVTINYSPKLRQISQFLSPILSQLFKHPYLWPQLEFLKNSGVTSYGHSMRATVKEILAKFKRYCTSMFKCLFLRSKSFEKFKNPESTDGSAPAMGTHRLWAIILQKKISLTWTRIKRLVCFCFGTGIHAQGISPPGDQNMAKK